MTTPQIDTYRDSAGDLLEQARTELAAGDVRQASEKGWGAAAQSVKAIAEARDWEHRNHAALFRAASQLAAATGDDDIHRWFHTASSPARQLLRGLAGRCRRAGGSAGCRAAGASPVADCVMRDAVNRFPPGWDEARVARPHRALRVADGRRGGGGGRGGVRGQVADGDADPQ